MSLISVIAMASCLVAGQAAAGSPQDAQGPVYTVGDGVSAPVVVKRWRPYTPTRCGEGRGHRRARVRRRNRRQHQRHQGDQGARPGARRGGRQGAPPLDVRAGKKDGKPVRVRITLEMTFTLRK